MVGLKQIWGAYEVPLIIDMPFLLSSSIIVLECIVAKMKAGYGEIIIVFCW